MYRQQLTLIAVLKSGIAAFIAFMPDAVEAQERRDSTQLPVMVIKAEPAPAATPFLPPIDGTRINAGKKTAVIDLGKIPQIVNHNYRQALAMTPGLVLAEDVTPLVSVGYRGLNPYRSQFTQMLKDGIPITMDMFGYPEAYYTPPLDGVDRIEFLHGGASLMFGPQPGGSLNYITHRPRAGQKLRFTPQHIVGSDNLYSTYNAVEGMVERIGYYGYFHHRQTDGFRKGNSDLGLFAGSAKVEIDPHSHSRLTLNLDAYSEEHGEPGGLTLEDGANAVSYRDNRNGVSRPFDRFRLDRVFGSLAWERDFSEETQLMVQGWTRYNYRLSRRQLGGGFGTLPTGPNASHNSIQLQRFYNQGMEARLRTNWGESKAHTFAAGTTLYHTSSPRTDRLGAEPGAEDGAIQARTQRSNAYAPFFVENRFKLGRFSFTPGARLENLWQRVEEKENVAKSAAGTALGKRSEYTFVPLFGVGAEYELKPQVVAYGNVSQSYRPKLFTEAVPTEPTSVINADLQEGKSYQMEIGLRGNARDYLNWDASAFLLDFSNQIGNVSLPGGITSVENVGRATHKGAEAAVQLELLGLRDALSGSEYRRHTSSIGVHGNIMLLDAEFKGGPQKGHVPQHAPHFTIRSGAVYRFTEQLKVAMLGTFVGEQFADDNNTAKFLVPGYSVWDLTLETRVYRNASVLAGVNNLFDRDYYSRIRSDGIDPAYRRNEYAGLSLKF